MAWENSSAIASAWPSLISRLAELEQEYADKTSILKPDYPAVVQIQRQMDAVKATLERQKEILGQNVAGVYQAALNRERLLEETFAHQRDVVNQIASKGYQECHPPCLLGPVRAFPEGIRIPFGPRRQIE